MTCDLPPQASEQTVTLTGLSSKITKMAGQDFTSEWLTVTQQNYTSGTPRVTLTATENLQTTARSAYIVLVATNDTLALTVRQTTYTGGGTDVDTPHDTSTDQPAYSRRQ
jgi:hypothetical protein